MDNVFFLFCPQFILQFIGGGGGGSNGLITEKTILFQGSKGSNIFQGGGGVLIIISKEAHITCDFPGGWGAGPPIPLWIRTCKSCNLGLF